MSDELKGSICYLIGPIDFSEDKGVGFRQKIIDELSGLGIVFLDPTSKMGDLAPDVGDEQETIRKLKEEEKWDELRQFMKRIVRSDLRCVDYSDFVIVYVDTDLHMCGSYHEVVCAVNQKKPVLTVIKGGRKKAPSWLFGILRTDAMFDDVESLAEYFKHPEFKLDERWVLFRDQIFQKQSEIFACNALSHNNEDSFVNEEFLKQTNDTMDRIKEMRKTEPDLLSQKIARFLTSGTRYGPSENEL